MIWSSSFFFPFFFIMIVFFFYMNLWSDCIVLSFSTSNMEVNFGCIFVVDFLSMCFFFCVGLVSLCVLLYSMSYMSSNLFKKKFIISMMVFILSMFILSASADLFWLMVGWDGLGLSSFFLIIFFQNWKSFNSSMITFLSNRLGDCLIIISLSWAIPHLSIFWTSHDFSYYSLILLVGAMSKSAQVPFSAWLPLAMAAPTPVSSLVHSSTLVTAGVYVMIRFKSFFVDLSVLIFYLSSLSIVLAGTSSLGEWDLKKIIALSTLSHIGLMIFFISMGAYYSVVCHLIMHAFFKSLLFMVAGIIIHDNNNTQDIRKLSLSAMSFPLGVSYLLSLISMMGVPFMSGFFSKESMFISSILNLSLKNEIIFFMSIFFTCMYSFRLIFYLFHNCSSIGHSSISLIDWFIFSFSCCFSIFSGNMLFGVFSNPDMMTELNYFINLKSAIFLIMGLSFSYFFLHKFLQKNCLYFFQNMWWILSTSLFFQKSFFFLTWIWLYKCDSKGMLDYMYKYGSDKMKLVSNFFLLLVSNPFSMLMELSMYIYMFWLILWAM